MSTISASTTSTTAFKVTADTTGTLVIQTGATPTTAVTVDASQNVGIGTASPADKLHVAISSGSLGGIRVQNTNASGQAALSYYNDTATQKADIWWNNSGSILYLRTLSTDPMVFSTNNTERMRIDSSGNLLVNTTSQVSQGKGNIAFNGSSHQGFNLQETANQSSAGFMYFQHNTTVLGTITRNGLTSAVQYNTTSDIRLKENIENANSALTTISNIKVRQYDWIGCEDSHQDYGFIAQELVEVVSGIVTKGRTEEDIWAVDYGKLTPILCKAIQEQQALITALTARIEALENK